MVLSYNGEEGIESTVNSGFDTSKPTLHVELMEDDSIIQILSSGIRQIKKVGDQR